MATPSCSTGAIMTFFTAAVVCATLATPSRASAMALFAFSLETARTASLVARVGFSRCPRLCWSTKT
eukprot:10713008-Alexandrium_andersonii.AAC.1